MTMRHMGIDEVVAALAAAAEIQVPDGDHEGDSLNACADVLPDDDFESFLAAHAAAFDYVRDGEGNPDRRAMRALQRRGFEVHLNLDQYDPLRMVGHVRVGERHIDISDPRP